MKYVLAVLACGLLSSTAALAQDGGDTGGPSVDTAGPSYDTGVSVEGGGANSDSRAQARAIQAARLAAQAVPVGDTGGPSFDTGTSVEGGAGDANSDGRAQARAIQAARLAAQAATAVPTGDGGSTAVPADTGGPYYDSGVPGPESGNTPDPTVSATQAQTTRAVRTARRPRG